MKSENQPIKKIWNFLGSRNLSVFIIITAVVHVLILFAFAFLIPLWWVEKIAGLLPYQFVSILFLVNIAICLIKWFPVARSRCRVDEITGHHPDSGYFPHRIRIGRGNVRPDEIEKLVKKKGYRILEAQGNDALFFAVRGRFSPLGTLLFHFSFFILLTGILVNLLFRFEGLTIIPEGVSFSAGQGNFRSITAAPLAKPPRCDFRLEKISASFWEKEILFTSLEARILSNDGIDTTRLSSPVHLGGSAVTIAGYGYAPEFVIEDKSGRIVKHGNVLLNVFVPGLEDFFFVEDLPYKVMVSFYPDFTMSAGKPSSKSMNPVHPAYGVRVLRGKLQLYSGILQPGERASFDEYRISFPSFRRWGEFKIIFAPGRVFIWIGFIVMIAALIWRLLFYRREIVLSQNEAGELWLAGRFEYYGGLNLAGFGTGFKKSMEVRP